jgi:hypothetical protein
VKGIAGLWRCLLLCQRGQLVAALRTESRDAACRVDKHVPCEVLSEALVYGSDLAEIDAEGRGITSLGSQGSKLEEAVRGRGHGAGIRVFRGDLHLTNHERGRHQSHRRRLLGWGRRPSCREREGRQTCHRRHDNSQHGGDARQRL